MALNKHELLKCTDEAVSAETKDENRIFAYFHDCCQLGLEILPFDLNKSQETCEFEGDRQLRIGFSAIASGNQQFIEDILAERQKHGGFRSFQDFCERLDLDTFPEHFWERSIEAGAFDTTGESRARLFAGYERILQGVRKAKADRALQQISLFATTPGQSVPIELPRVDEWTEEERIEHERHGLGFSFSAYLQQQEELASDSSEESPHEILPLNIAEAAVYNEADDTLSENDDLPHPPTAMIPSSTVENPLESAVSAQPSSLSEEVPLTEEKGEDESITTDLSKTLIIQLSTQTITEQTLLALRDLLEQFHGDVDVLLEFSDPSNEKILVKTDARYAVHISESLIEAIAVLCGQHAVRIVRV